MSDYYDSDEDDSEELKQGNTPLAPQLEPLRNSLVEKGPRTAPVYCLFSKTSSSFIMEKRKIVLGQLLL